MSIPLEQTPSVTAAPAAAAPQRNYFSETQQPIYSAALVLPFMLVYQTGLIVLKSRVINGGDAIITTLSQSLFRTVGVEASFASIIVPIGAFLIWQFHKKGTWTIQPPVLVATFFESLIYAVVLYMLLGYFVHYLPGNNITAPAPAPAAAVSTQEPSVSRDQATPVPAASRTKAGSRRPGVEDFVLFCGAGVYEELVFRVFLLGLLLLIFTKFFHMEHAYAAAWAAVTGAVIFSAFHHIGGEPFAVGPFLQRIVAGIYFSAIYFTRSFGVAAASHAMYDIIVGLEMWKHY
jgi:hypothetical protein